MTNFPEHIEWLKEQWGVTLSERLHSENVNLTIDKALSSLIEVDPTSKSVLVDWLVKSYAKSGFRWEDIKGGKQSKVANTLEAFVEHQSKLDRLARDPYQYPTLASLWRAVKPFVDMEGDLDTDGDQPSNRALKRAEREEALAESYLLWRDSKVIAAVPLSTKAAQWWGRGTRWCTAATQSENMFWDYHDSAPLIVIILNLEGGSRKLQMHCDHNNFQFMDEDDEEVKSSFIEENWSYLEPFLQWAVEQNLEAAAFIPPSYYSLGMFAKAIKAGAINFDSVPTDFRTYPICLLAVRQDGNNLHRVPLRKRDIRICKAAVEQNGNSLNAVPEKFRTSGICLAAVKQASRALCCVPDQLKNLEICSEAVKTNGDALQYVPAHLITVEMCICAMSSSDRAAFYIPQRILDSEESILRMVEEVPNLEQARFSVIFYKLKDHLPLSKIFMKVVEISAGCFINIPKKYINYEMCYIAVRENKRNIHYVPKDIFTQALVEALENELGTYFRYVPEKFITLELSLKAVEQDGKAIGWVPDKWRSKEMFLIALRSNPSCFPDVPLGFHDENVYLAAVKKDGMLLANIPLKSRTREIYLAAVKQNTLALAYTSPEVIDDSFCKEIVGMQRDLIRYAPEQVREQIKSYLQPEWEREHLLTLEEGLTNHFSQLEQKEENQKSSTVDTRF